MQCLQQRCLVIECLACVGDEDGRNAKRIVDDEDRTCRVPGRIASCLESVPDAAVGEGAGIRLLLYEQFAGEFLHHTALSVMLDEGVMLLCCTFCQGLEPVGVVRRTVFLCPLLHALCHGIGDGTVQTCSVVDDIHQLLIDVNRQVFVHLRAVEHILPVEFSRAFFGRADLEGAFPESFLDCFKS